MPFVRIKLLVFLGLFTPTLLFSQFVQFPYKVWEYKPAPGQFINTLFGTGTAAQSIVGTDKGGVSLGAFGGYVVIGFEKPVENDVNNPYGIDFSVFGNANGSSSEPAQVYVMKDKNQNGIPDDEWYLLAGSDYWFSETIKDYEITYFNPGGLLAADVEWEDNQGNTGIIPANEFHAQTYYPIQDSIPGIDSAKYKLSGVLIQDRLDDSNSGFITSQKYPFGYADNQQRNLNYSGWEPDNPYTPKIEGTGGDGFDINWAIDSEGSYIDLDKIDFIKIQTAVNALAGWLGEVSAEVMGVVDIAPNGTITGENKIVVLQPGLKYIKTGSTMQLLPFAFLNGRLDDEATFSWQSKNEEVAVVDENGLITAKNAGIAKIKVSWALYPEISDSIEISVVNALSMAENEDQNLVVYPNPVTDKLNLKGSNSYCRYRVFNNVGVLIDQGEIIENSINTDKLFSGCYIIELSGGNRKIYENIIKI